MSTQFSKLEATDLSAVTGGCHDNNNNRYPQRNPYAFGAASAGRNANAFAGWPFQQNTDQRSWWNQAHRGMPFSSNGGGSCSRR